MFVTLNLVFTVPQIVRSIVNMRELSKMSFIPNRCPKTISGKHDWTGGYRSEGYTSHSPIPGGGSFYVSPRWVDKECKYCGIIDDTVEKTI